MRRVFYFNNFFNFGFNYYCYICVMKKIQLSIILFLLITKLFSQTDGTCLSGNCVDGYGTLQTVSGHTYTGKFKNGKFEDTNGILVISDDGYYSQGGFRNGEFHGFVTHNRGIKSVSKKTEMNYIDGLPHGYCKKINETYIEEGNMINWKKEGLWLETFTQYKSNGFTVLMDGTKLNAKYVQNYVWYSNGKQIKVERKKD